MIGTACKLILNVLTGYRPPPDDSYLSVCYSAEHHVIYQYNLVGAKDHYMGLIQTESVSSKCFLGVDLLISALLQPYFQPKPAVPTPFSLNSRYHDPAPYPGNASAWALNVYKSHGILVFGAFA